MDSGEFINLLFWNTYSLTKLASFKFLAGDYYVQHLRGFWGCRDCNWGCWRAAVGGERCRLCLAFTRGHSLQHYLIPARVCPRYDPLRVIASTLKRTCSGKNVFSEYLSKAVRCSKSMGVKNMQVKCFAQSQTLFVRVILLTEVCPVGWSCLFGCPKGWVSGGGHGVGHPRYHGQRPCSSRASVLSPGKEVGSK